MNPSRATIVVDLDATSERNWSLYADTSLKVNCAIEAFEIESPSAWLRLDTVTTCCG